MAVCWLVGRLVCHNFRKRREVKLHAPIGTLVNILQRLGAAAAEMEYGEKKGNFDVIIVNDDLHQAYIRLRYRIFQNYCPTGCPLNNTTNRDSIPLRVSLLRNPERS